MTGVDSETTVPPHVASGDGTRERCNTEKPTPSGPYTCTAEAGHDGPHAAYSSADHLCHAWPRDEAADRAAALAGTGLVIPSGQTAELDGTEQDPERAAYTAGLRQLADALDAHPEIPLPYDGHDGPITIQFLFGADPRAEMAAAVRALPCAWRKDARDDQYFDLNGNLAGLKLHLVAFRDEVCTRRVTGTEEREVEEIVTPAVIRKVTKPVEVVEWTCEPILAPRQDGAS